LARVNNTLTTAKVLIPTITIVVLLFAHFHSANFTAAGGFFVHGDAFKSILIAVPTGGIVFALTGFEQAVQLGGESSNPKRDLPRAVVFSIAIGAAIYILVQIAFIGALDPALLDQVTTWAGLATAGNNSTLAALNAAPFYAVALSAGVVWLAAILRIDAILSPGGTGLIYVTTTSRISFALSKNGYLPIIFEKNSQRTKVPTVGVIITALIGLLFLLPFPSWTKLVGVVTSATVLMYAGAPLALGALRLQKPDLPRAYKLPLGRIVAPLAFVFANFIVYWAGWQTYSTLMLVMVVGLTLIGGCAVFKLNPNKTEIDWGAAVWLFPYLAGMGVISYFGGFGKGDIIGGIGIFKNVLIGGNGALPLYWDIAVLTAFSLLIYFLAIATRLPSDKVDRYVRDVYPPPTTE